MKALSIQQPWAYCITHGTKRVENRTWYTLYRGYVLIHAGKKYQTDMEHPIHADSPEVPILGMLTAPRGCVVGVARIVDCVSVVTDYDRIPLDQRIWSAERGTRGQFVFVLSDVRAFSTPMPCKGALGLFDILDEAIVNAAAELMSAAR